MYFHGTTKEAGESIVRSRFFKPSCGDRHWLGDGYYFYVNEEYAFRWILLKYTESFTNKYSKNYDSIFSEYSIISADIITSEERVFSLDDINNKLFFINVKNVLQKKAQYSKIFSSQLKRDGIVDGVVINILFETMGYETDYDYVKATYPISYKYDTDSRMDFLPEPQICVKNIGIITNIMKYNKDELPEKYKNFIDSYNAIKYDHKNRKVRTANNSYKKKSKIIYK